MLLPEDERRCPENGAGALRASDPVGAVRMGHAPSRRAAGHPEIRFASTAVEQVDEGVYAVTGDLTIKDVSRPVSVDFALTGSAQDPWGNLRVGFEGALTIKRSDWGLTWNTPLDTGGVLVSDRIQIEFDVSAVRAGLPPGP